MKSREFPAYVVDCETADDTILIGSEDWAEAVDAVTMIVSDDLEDWYSLAYEALAASGWEVTQAEEDGTPCAVMRA